MLPGTRIRTITITIPGQQEQHSKSNNNSDSGSDSDSTSDTTATATVRVRATTATAMMTVMAMATAMATWSDGDSNGDSYKMNNKAATVNKNKVTGSQWWKRWWWWQWLPISGDHNSDPKWLQQANKQAASTIKVMQGQWQDRSLARWCWQQLLPRSRRQQQDVFIAVQCDNQVLPAATTKGSNDHHRWQHCGAVRISCCQWSLKSTAWTNGYRRI